MLLLGCISLAHLVADSNLEIQLVKYVKSSKESPNPLTCLSVLTDYPDCFICFITNNHTEYIYSIPTNE